MAHSIPTAAELVRAQHLISDHAIYTHDGKDEHIALFQLLLEKKRETEGF